jgi:hypothetical protein
MNPEPEALGRRRIAREDCEVGDWVNASAIPEWSAELPSHVFRRGQISISPEDGGMGGMLPDQFEEWSFVAERRGAEFVWVRAS